MSILPALDNYRRLIDQALRELPSLREPSGPHDRLTVKAMNYSLHAGGKRLRPILLLESNRLSGGTIEKALPFACAIELVHTYSLIHDDLPAMDNDDLRRGVPTSHKVFGEAQAILAGDGLLNLAYETLLDAVEDPLSLAAARTLARASGSRGMIGGQSLDVSTEGRTIDLETLTCIHLNKTTRLIQSALEAGALLANADEQSVRLFGRFGFHLGMAFQIKDDLLDIEGDEALLGKPIGSDAESGKNTYPVLAGLDKAKESLETHTGKALDHLARLPGDTDFLQELAHYLLKRRT